MRGAPRIPALAAGLTGLLASAAAAEPWLSGWPGPDAGFIVRNELQLAPLTETGFWVQAMAIVGIFPLGFLAALAVSSGLFAFFSRSGAEGARALVMLFVGLFLAFLVPGVMGWAALVTIQDETMNLDFVLGGGLALVVLATSVPLATLARQKRLHGKASFLFLLLPPALPVVAGLQYVHVLDAPDGFGAPVVQLAYDGLLFCSAFQPAWLTFVVFGGATAFSGLVLSPLASQGILDILGALKDKVTG